MSAVRYAIDFVRHWLSANTRHGTHSPFVYCLLDEVVYADRKTEIQTSISFSSPKLNHVVNRIIKDHGPKQLLVYDLAEPITLGPKAAVIVQYSANVEPEQSLERLLAAAHLDTLLIIPEIYRNKWMKKVWNAVKADSKVTVSIDFFYFGLVYFHKGQAKENFKIRV
jgi:hypothetical protein